MAPEDALEFGREIGVLAASHASLDPTRRARRADIAIESLLQILNDGPLSEAQLVKRMQALWNTNSITGPLVRSALGDALASGLVARQESLIDSQWVLTDEARRDCVDDLQWAGAVVDRFEAQVKERIEDDPNRLLIPDDAIPKIATRLREAITIGAEGLYSVEMSSDPRHLRPLKFNEREALDHLGQTQPRSHRIAAQRLFIAAINPMDSFAEELVHLIVAGNILHGMITRRDLPSKPTLDGVRLAVDTSVIVPLAPGDGDEYEAIKEAFTMSTSLGAEVVVASHTISEWTRLFDAGDAEMSDMQTDADLGALSILIDNPFIRGFALAVEGTPDLTWARFRSQWRDPTARLVEVGVQVRPNGNDGPEDRELFQSIRRILARLNRERTDRRLRNAAALDADAESATMVARWRRKLTKDSAYFIAQDRMTGRAYREAVPDDAVPLCVTLTAWVTIVAALTTDNPEERARCASIVRSIALRESFMALAAGYTLKELTELATVLNEDDGPIEPNDINEFLQQSFEDIETEIANADRDDLMRLRASQIISNRAARRSQRAKRSQDALAEQLAAIRSEERESADLRVARAIREGDVQRSNEATDAERALAKQRRVTVVVAVSLVTAATAIVLLLTDSINSGARWAVLASSIVLVIAFLVAYYKEKAEWWALLGVGIVALAVNVLSAAVPALF